MSQPAEVEQAIVVIRERRMLQSALKIIVGAKVSIGHAYYAYTLANLLFENVFERVFLSAR